MIRTAVSAPVLGYTTLRLAIGMSMFMHGVARLPKISAFTEATVKMFADSPFPRFAVAWFARATPPIELLIGALILLGLALRFALTLGALWMVLLIFGSTLIEKYDIVGIQLIYSLIFFVLLQYIENDRLSVDGLIGRGQKAAE